MRYILSSPSRRIRIGLSVLVLGTGLVYPSLGAQAQSGGEVTANTVVDCLLPGTVRRLGQSMTYLSARKPQRLKVRDCEVRGGEYVLYDLAAPETALKLWSQAAKSGDAEAQRRVAQIFEMGLNGAPDYVSAAQWYRRSAEAGNRASALALAALYSEGQGVEKNAAEARKWSERAAQSKSGAESTQTQALLQRIDELERQLAAGPRNDSLRQTYRNSINELEQAARSGSELLEAVAQKPAIELVDPILPRTRGLVNSFTLREPQPNKSVTGWVNLRSRLNKVTLNGQPVTVDSSGFFSKTVPLNLSGETPVSITATQQEGKQTEFSFVINQPDGKRQTSAAVEPELQTLGKVRPSQAGQNYALVIGINAYPHMPKLETAVHDARTVGAVLEQRYGYRVKYLVDATMDQILIALNEYVPILRQNDSLLIYYAGHGILDPVNKRAYWIPVDGKEKSDERWIPSYRVTDIINKYEARKIILVTDSCYSGAFAADLTGAITGVRAGLSEGGQRKAIDALWGSVSRTVLTSGMFAPVSDEDDDNAGKPTGHSLFGRAFIEVLREARESFTGDQLYNTVHARVLKRSFKLDNNEQSPLYAALSHAGHESGDYLFFPR